MNPSRSKPLGLVLATVLALLLWMAVPAFAHHKEGHDKGGGSAGATGSHGDHDGDADSDPATTQKEATNAVDDGDNAHPSREDRSVENTWDSDSNPNQGKSESDPDDPADGRGPTDRCEDDGDGCGIDKPNSNGGTDEADQDGNNGCGNDDDFDDDNNGWCGKPEDVNTTTTPPVVGAAAEESDADTVVKGRTDVALPEEVLGVRFTAPNVVAAAARPATVAAAALPFTGVALLPLALLGMAFVGTGTAMVRRKQ